MAAGAAVLIWWEEREGVLILVVAHGARRELRQARVALYSEEEALVEGLRVLTQLAGSAQLAV
jgi:hypothetical protein